MADFSLSYTGTEINARLDRPVPVSGGGTGETSVYDSVTVTADTTTASGHNITARRFPYLKMCFVRGVVTFDHVAVEANTWVRVGSVPTTPTDYSPRYTTALAATKATASGATARITSDGYIEVASPTAFYASYTYYIYFSGWWINA